MSIDAMHWVWEESKSKGVARHILLAIADTARTNIDDCQAYASVRFLAGRANCSNGAVTEAVTLLVDSKELEVVRDAAGNVVKGKHGATCYRLPLAVGFVRAAVRNRSAQQNDSTPNSSTPDRPAQPNDPAPDEESDRSAQRNDPAFGSAERSDAKSFGSAGHYTKRPPEPPTTQAPAGPSPSEPSGREGGGITALNQDQQTAYRTLARLTAKDPRLALGETELADLAPLVAQWLQRAPAEHLHAALTAGLPSAIGNPAGFLRKRLVQKMPPPPQPDEAEGRCTRPNCDPITHMLTLPDHSLDYCPTCHPTGRARARRTHGAAA